MFLNRGPVTLRTLIVVIVAVGSGIAGYRLFLLHQDLLLSMAVGAHLDALRSFVAEAPTPVTVIVGWLAAVGFTIALVLLYRGPLEPAVLMRHAERRSVTDMRRGLRREYTVVRVLLVFVLLITAVDLARAVSFAVGSQHSGVSTAVPWTLYVEVLGFLAATAVLTAYARAFGETIARLGAI